MLAGGPQQQDRRRERYAARTVLWRESQIDRCRGCGLRRHDAEQDVQVRVSTDAEGVRRAGFGNLQSCGSVWCCPVCSHKIAAERNTEIQAALRWWTSDPTRAVSLVTFTVRHRRQNRLRTVWDTVASAWDAVTSGGAWKAEQRQWGVPTARVQATGKRAGRIHLAHRIHVIRVFEVTYGGNGWHVHVHALLLHHADLEDKQLRLLAGQMFTRWKAVCVDRGLGAPTLRHGIDARRLHGDPSAALGEYFTKAAYRASHEVTHGAHTKTARHGNRTPFQILADVVAKGEADDLDTWHEWERGSKGRRQIAWSTGLRKMVPTVEEVERTDEEIADDTLDGTIVADVPQTSWSAVCGAGVQGELLDAFERSDADGHAFLAVWLAIADRADAA